MIKYFTIEDLLKHYLQKKFHILHQDPSQDKELDFRHIKKEPDQICPFFAYIETSDYF